MEKRRKETGRESGKLIRLSGVLVMTDNILPQGSRDHNYRDSPTIRRTCFAIWLLLHQMQHLDADTKRSLTKIPFKNYNQRR